MCHTEDVTLFWLRDYKIRCFKHRITYQVGALVVARESHKLTVGKVRFLYLINNFGGMH